MRCALDVLFADVPAEQVDEARDFYASRAVGRGPSTPEELKEARARRAVPRAAGPPAVEETIEAAETRVPLRIFPPVEGPPRRSGSSTRPMPASERPGSGNANYTARSLMTGAAGGDAGKFTLQVFRGIPPSRRLRKME
ncbi:predicted protein [Streptomyces viridosporus ATCC 14672]|uniref:Predicted protein n=1 Tax=Streptomyces viridosporus (strain ATCC 14672 / DSM 40746 / JCM 4963 / KCTC 9882 / NRRL B-12104 / FH 1290) TaxID=566461 RepID=D5ZVR5_STRV1|nr:predicted protein [Streptomyces viridosporus ATCC 14672]